MMIEQQPAMHFFRVSFYAFFSCFLALSACGGGDGGGPGEGGSGGSGEGGSGGSGAEVSFKNVHCTPAIEDGAPVVAGQKVVCGFTVEGPAGAMASLSCEAPDGGTLDCLPGAQGSSTSVKPAEEVPLPIASAFLTHTTKTADSGKHGIVVVATAGAKTHRHAFEFDVVADDPSNHPPTIALRCDPVATGDTVTVQAGQPLGCEVAFGDSDPDTLTWSYTEESGALPKNEPTPFGGAGTATVLVNWQWQPDHAEAGTTWKYVFTVEDGTNAPVSRTLTVKVE